MRYSITRFIKLSFQEHKPASKRDVKGMDCFAEALPLLAAKKSPRFCRWCQRPHGFLRVSCPQLEGKKGIPKEAELGTVTEDLSVVGSKELHVLLCG